MLILEPDKSQDSTLKDKRPKNSRPASLIYSSGTQESTSMPYGFIDAERVAIFDSFCNKVKVFG
jgi:hypothetical protein